MSLLCKGLLAAAVHGVLSAQLTPLPGSWRAYEALHHLSHAATKQPPTELRRSKASLDSPTLRGNKVSLKTSSGVNHSAFELLADSHKDHIIVIPEYKLLFCSIDHNYRRNFTSFFDSLKGTIPHTSGSAPSFGNGPGKSQLLKKDLDQILKDKTWHKAVFLRDPLDRFLSAMLERCTLNINSCSDPKLPTQPTTFATVVVRTLQDLTKARVRGVATGLDWQANYCGGIGSMIDQYDTIEVAEPATLQNRVETMLTKLGIKKLGDAGFSSYFPDLKHQCPDCSSHLGKLLESVHPNVTTLLPVFPEAGVWERLGGNTRGPGAAAANAQVVSSLLKLYKSDYDMLGMKVPLWAHRIIEDSAESRRWRGKKWAQGKGRRRRSTTRSRPLPPKRAVVVEAPYDVDGEEHEEGEKTEGSVDDRAAHLERSLEDESRESAKAEQTLTSKLRYERDQTAPALEILAGEATIAAASLYEGSAGLITLASRPRREAPGPEESFDDTTSEDTEESSDDPTSEDPAESSVDPTSEDPGESPDGPTSEDPEVSPDDPTREDTETGPEDPTSVDTESSPDDPTSEDTEMSPDDPTSEDFGKSPDDPTSDYTEESPEDPSSEDTETSPDDPTSEDPGESPDDPTSEDTQSSPPRVNAMRVDTVVPSLGVELTSEDLFADVASEAPVATSFLYGQGARIVSQLDKLRLE